MSTTVTTTQSPSKSKKGKDKDRKDKAQQQANERLKTVIRRLPPNLPEDIFWQTVQKWVTEETVSWKIYHVGKFKKRMNKENIPSRAYIVFKDEELLTQFSREFDGHLFKDKAGNESYAIVEYAPYQKVPSEKRKQDSKNNTIEKDEDYISFINALNAPTGEPVTLEALIAATRPPEPPKTTPLLEALKAEKSAQKDKEAILRNHAHYKDQTNVAAIATNPNRKDDKKKPPAPPPPAISTQSSKDAAAPLSKKAKKKAAEAQKAAAVAAAAKPVAEAKSGAASQPATTTTAKPSKKHKALAPAAPAAPPVILAARPAAAPAPVVASKANSSGPTEAPSAEAPPSRRPRAVIGRQLGLALGDIGASARSPKERGKEKPTAEPKPETKTGVPAIANGDQTVPAKDRAAPAPPASTQPPPSPSRHRNRRGGGPPSTPASVPMKAPPMAQRTSSGGAPAAPTILQKAAGPPVPGVLAPPTPTDRARGAPRGGRGGGRGRGGRGGPPARGG